MSPGTRQTVVAIFGTTISPYLSFGRHRRNAKTCTAVKADKALRSHPAQAARQLARIKTDTYIGMGFSNLIAFFIMPHTAATLHAHGVTDIQTSAQAAEALRPIAGNSRSFSLAWGSSARACLRSPF
jgi:Mn2+/Fe2+ NRAMP family transporter